MEPASAVFPYEKLYKNRFPLLRKAFKRWQKKKGVLEAREKLKEALLEETQDYCFYMAVKNHFQGKSWDLWAEDIKLRRPDAVRKYQKELRRKSFFISSSSINFSSSVMA